MKLSGNATFAEDLSHISGFSGDSTKHWSEREIEGPYSQLDSHLQLTKRTDRFCSREGGILIIKLVLKLFENIHSFLLLVGIEIQLEQPIRSCIRLV